MAINPNSKCKENIPNAKSIYAPGFLWAATIDKILPDNINPEWIKISLKDLEKYKDNDFYNNIVKEKFLTHIQQRSRELISNLSKSAGLKIPTFQFHKKVSDIIIPGFTTLYISPGFNPDANGDFREFAAAYYSINYFKDICYPKDRLKCLKSTDTIYINFKKDGTIHSICLHDVEPCEKKVPPIPIKEEVKVDLVEDDKTVSSFQIGISKLPVSPIFISVERRTNIEQIPVLRQPTSLQKGTGHQEIIVTFSCYFYEREQIRKALVPLIAHFRYTPFVPVINDYLNDEHDIDALALQNLTLSTVEGFPKLIKADLTCLKFDWRNYILWPPDDVTSFADCINWFLYKQYIHTLTKDIAVSLNDSDVTFKYVAEGFLKKREKEMMGAK